MADQPRNQVQEWVQGQEPTFTTIPALLEESARQYADREALVDGDFRISFTELLDEAFRCARGLVASGVEPGDRVAIWASNSHRWVLAALGILCAGAVIVPLNTRFKGDEARYILERAGVSTLVVENGFHDLDYLGMLRSAGRPESVRVIVDIGERPEGRSLGWEELLAGAETVPTDVVRRRVDSMRPTDISDVLFTSGTTGRPKGVISTHRQNLRVYHWWSEAVGLREGDRHLVVNPFFHSFGLKTGIIASLQRGVTILPMAVLDVAELLRLVEAERISVLPGPPTLYIAVLDHPDRAGRDLSSVRLAVTGAAVVPVAVVERMRTELAFETVITAYGLTESTGTATVNTPEADSETIATTVGVPLPGTEVQVIDGDGNPLPRGNAGEVVIRGYNVMAGYYADPGATAAAIDADGRLHSGDVGYIDDHGHLRITDRLKDMFVVGGFNAYPAEIEQVLARHPGVSEAAVVGVPDERLGEVGQAFVVARPGCSPSEDELVGFCRERLANYKVPRSVRIVTDLPRNASGKVLKYRLRDDE